MKKWMRSRTNRMFAGVIGGISEKVGMNANLLRMAFVILMFATAFFPLTILYILLVFILPNDQGDPK